MTLSGPRASTHCSAARMAAARSAFQMLRPSTRPRESTISFGRPPQYLLKLRRAAHQVHVQPGTGQVQHHVEVLRKLAEIRGQHEGDFARLPQAARTRAVSASFWAGERSVTRIGSSTWTQEAPREASCRSTSS